jgi:peptidyl-tRNA hydrolase
VLRFAVQSQKQGKKMLSVKKLDNLIEISSNAEWLGKVIGYD